LGTYPQDGGDKIHLYGFAAAGGLVRQIGSVSSVNDMTLDYSPQGEPVTGGGPLLNSTDDTIVGVHLGAVPSAGHGFGARLTADRIRLIQSWIAEPTSNWIAVIGMFFTRYPDGSQKAETLAKETAQKLNNQETRIFRGIAGDAERFIVAVRAPDRETAKKMAADAREMRLGNADASATQNSTWRPVAECRPNNCTWNSVTARN
jgi:hypothetical protein